MFVKRFSVAVKFVRMKVMTRTNDVLDEEQIFSYLRVGATTKTLIIFNRPSSDLIRSEHVQ